MYVPLRVPLFRVSAFGLTFLFGYPFMLTDVSLGCVLFSAYFLQLTFCVWFSENRRLLFWSFWDCPVRLFFWAFRRFFLLSCAFTPVCFTIPLYFCNPFCPLPDAQFMKESCLLTHLPFPADYLLHVLNEVWSFLVLHKKTFLHLHIICVNLRNRFWAFQENRPFFVGAFFFVPSLYHVLSLFQPGILYKSHNLIWYKSENVVISYNFLLTFGKECDMLIMLGGHLTGPFSFSFSGDGLWS